MSRSPLSKLTAEARDIVHDASADLTRDAEHVGRHLERALDRTSRVLAKTSRVVAADVREEAGERLRGAAHLIRNRPGAALAAAFVVGLTLSAALVRFGKGRRA